MSTSASASYSTAKFGGSYNYELLLTNTSSPSFDLYAFMFGQEYGVPVATDFPLQDVALISAPPGWTGIFNIDFAITWQTSYQGTSAASGYLLPGQTGVFSFQSSTAPPASIRFGCCFYNNVNSWG